MASCAGVYTGGAQVEPSAIHQGEWTPHAVYRSLLVWRWFSGLVSALLR